MNEREAFEEAQRRWGDTAHVDRERCTAVDRYLVGIRGVRIFHIKGRGQTWEEAFKAADAKALSRAGSR